MPLGRSRPLGQRPRLGPILGVEIAGDAFMEAALAKVSDVEGYHAARNGKAVAERLASRSKLLMPFWKLMTKVLSRGMGRDVARGVGGVPLLTHSAMMSASPRASGTMR